MKNIFESSWWSLQLPEGWEWEEDEDCVSFFSDDSVGELEVSAYQKEGAKVDDADLLEFIPEEIPVASGTPVKIGEFTGFLISYHEDEVYWRQWWLKAGQILVYLTYNTDSADQGTKDAVTDQIVSTLKLRPPEFPEPQQVQ